MEIIRWYTGGSTTPHSPIDYNNCTRHALIRLDAVDIEVMSSEFKKQLMNENTKYNIENGIKSKSNFDIRVEAESKEEFEKLLLEKVNWLLLNTNI